LWIKMPDR